MTDDVGLALQIGCDEDADLAAETDHRAEIFADLVRIDVDRGDELHPRFREQEARDLVHRGLADALVVSGKATGEATAVSDVKRVRGAVRDVPLLVGSGVTERTDLADLAPNIALPAHGFSLGMIQCDQGNGTALHRYLGGPWEDLAKWSFRGA